MAQKTSKPFVVLTNNDYAFTYDPSAIKNASSFKNFKFKQTIIGSYATLPEALKVAKAIPIQCPSVNLLLNPSKTEVCEVIVAEKDAKFRFRKQIVKQMQDIKTEVREQVLK